MKTLLEIFANYAVTQPKVLFAADRKGASLNYGAAWSEVLKVAGNLRELGNLNKGDHILVKCNQSVEYLIVYLACNLIGTVFIPVENNISFIRIKDIVAETGCKLVISDKREDLFCKALLYKELFKDRVSNLKISFPKVSDIAEILFTTGTTGKSKGIVLTQAANVALAENIKNGVSMRPYNIELIPLAMSHSHGLRTFYANLLNGGSVVISDGVMNVKDIFNLIDKYKVTSMDLSPSAAQVLIKLSKGIFWDKAKKLDYIEIGTAKLPETLKEELRKNLPGVRLYNFYGSTESGRTCVLNFSIDSGKKNCIGKPAINAKIVFTDDDRNIIGATPQNLGLLASSGAMNMLCYYNNSVLTQEIIRNGYVCTNDLGYCDNDGYVYVVGRRDDVITYNGLKISPTEVEDVILENQDIVEAACVGKADKAFGQIPVLFVVPKNISDFDMEKFKLFLQENLDGNKMPKKIELLEALPRMYNGKLNRRQLECL